ncbi:hypothetical protein IW261DRAFT_1014643 [Armillaria novae-zelandiae]|uniref:Secreted protein n=1 Tax=Armillaria novae-zelandiae TaxID=153914 RepID=A0AA39NN82_9AGAR|nr:hypothetical protein IW261DRAFT_1014643 [Armillaria novae-zelandiae]
MLTYLGCCYILLTMMVENICTGSVSSESVKQPQTQHATHSRRFSRRKATVTEASSLFMKAPRSPSMHASAVQPVILVSRVRE